MLHITPFHSLHGIVGPKGRYSLPGDKSLSHRAALLASLAQGDSRIENFLISGVTQAMLNALTALGVTWTLKGTILIVHGRGPNGMKYPTAPLDCGNSATTLRLLAGGLAGAGVAATLTGSPGLCKRPMRRIITPLQEMGVAIQASPQGTAPLYLEARSTAEKLSAIDFKMPVSSAQVKSAILLAALAADRLTVVREPGHSRDHTERMLSAMGVKISQWVEVDKDPAFVTQLTPPANQFLAPLRMRLPCDISSAAFLIVAALITPNSEIMIQGVGLNPTRTGLIEALQEMGADIDVLPLPDQGGEPAGDLVVRYSQLRGCEVDGDLVVRMIDEFPAFAVAAAYAEGDTLVADAAELRNKESDRISALCSELVKLGAKLEERPDGFLIHGEGSLHGGTVDPHGDHRLAMALAVAGLASKGTVHVQSAEIIAESFPEFVPILRYLGAKFTEDSQQAKL